MTEDWVKDARSEANEEFNAQSEVEKELGTLKESQTKLSEQLKKVIKANDSSEVGLRTAEKQAEEQCK